MGEFKDRLKPKERKQSKMPWDFQKPTYDQARAGNIYAGDDYGSGVTQPVGKFQDAGVESGPIPQNSFKFPARECIDGEI